MDDTQIKLLDEAIDLFSRFPKTWTDFSTQGMLKLRELEESLSGHHETQLLRSAIRDFERVSTGWNFLYPWGIKKLHNLKEGRLRKRTNTRAKVRSIQDGDKE